MNECVCLYFFPILLSVYQHISYLCVHYLSQDRLGHTPSLNSSPFSCNHSSPTRKLPISVEWWMCTCTWASAVIMCDSYPLCDLSYPSFCVINSFHLLFGYANLRHLWICVAGKITAGAFALPRAARGLAFHI